MMSMLRRTLVSARIVANSAQMLSKNRGFSTRELIAITDVRKGMMIKIEEKYCEVKEWQPHKQGRGAAAYNVTYDELDTGKGEAAQIYILRKSLQDRARQRRVPSPVHERLREGGENRGAGR